ncbi:uncharacterized protein LOC144354718 [Saccoglossus kowalevskii]
MTIIPTTVEPPNLAAVYLLSSTFSTGRSSDFSSPGREREVEAAIEKIANASLLQLLGDEKKATLTKEKPVHAISDEHDNSELEGTTVNITASVDGAWQKRGSGRSYNSLSG